MVDSNFWEWVDNRKQERNISSDAKLARLMGISSGALHHSRSGRNKITYDFCRALADALGLPIEDVLRKAGLLPPKPTDANTEYIINALSDLPEKERLTIREFAEYRYYIHKQNKRGQSK